MRKRIIALLLACAVLLSLLPAAVLAAEEAQTVSTAAEFAAMDPAGCYRLAEDVTVTQPYGGVFTGTLDGGGHTVTLALTAGEDAAALALFPAVDGAAFENLRLTGTVTGGSALSYAAALIGAADGDVTVTACRSDAALTVTAPDSITGGLVAAQLSGTLTMTGCAVTGPVTAPAAAACGGLLGRQEPYAALTLTACYLASDVTGGSGEESAAGGLVGAVGGDAALQSCWSAASPEDQSAALTAWGSQSTVRGAVTGDLVGAVDSGASLTGSRCFWIAAAVGSGDAFRPAASGLFPEYGADRRAALLDALNDPTLPERCTFLLPDGAGWPLLRWESADAPDPLETARAQASAAMAAAYTEALAAVEGSLTALRQRTGLWYELLDAAEQTAAAAAAALADLRTDALAALTAAQTEGDIQRLAAQCRTDMTQTAADAQRAIGGNGVSAEKKWDGVTLTRPASGSGTAADPYRIAQASELAWFAAQVNGGSTALCARLTAALDLNDHPWTPIGSTTGVDTSDGYCGTFDGGGFVIHGLSVTDPDAERSYIGLFGTVASGGVVENVKLAGNLTCAQRDSGGNRILNYGAGGIAGRSAGILYRCEASVYLTAASGAQPAVHTGGIVGQLCGDGIADGCTSRSTLTSGGAGLSYTGGIAGTVWQNAVVRYCRSSGSVTGLRNVGGIAGFLSGSAQLRECENAAAVSGTVAVGGIAGRLDKDAHFSASLDAVVTHVTNTAAVSGTSGNSCGTGGIVGWVGCAENGAYTGSAALSYLYNSGAVTASGSTGGTACGGLIGNWKTGAVTHGENASANRLWGVAETLGTAAEDAVQVSALRPDVSCDASRWDKTAAARTLLARHIGPADPRFALYGDAQSAVYNGILLDYLRRTEQSADAAETEALLAACETELQAVLTGVSAAGAQLLEDLRAYASARLYGAEDAAQVDSLLTQAARDVAAAVTVRDVTLLRQTYLGTDRLDGLLQRIPTYPARLRQELYNAFLYQKTYAPDDMARLLYTYESWCLQIEQAPSLSAADAHYADARLALSRLAATLRLTDTVPDMDACADAALALARQAAQQVLTDAADDRIAALSALTGPLDRYPAALRQRLTAALAYSAAAIRGAAEGVDFSGLTAYAAIAQTRDDGLTAVTTAYDGACHRLTRLLDSASGLCWDGASVRQPSGSGTPDDPYRITAAPELAWLAQAVNGGLSEADAVLAADIDLGYHPWPVIGASHPYTGTFDGQGHTVSGLYIGETAGRAALGLFGAVSGTICKLTVRGSIELSDVDAQELPDALSIGGLLAVSDGVAVTGCTAQVDITVSLTNQRANQSAAIGGVTGRITGDSRLTDCRNEGALTVTLAPGSSYLGGSGRGGLGGIAGSVCAAAVLERCVNAGTVTAGRAAGVGGIAGRLDGGSAAIVLTQCASQGPVSNDTAASLIRRGGVGGIAGLAVSGAVTIECCYNTAAISGHTIVGGILGGESGDYAASIPSYEGNAALVVRSCYNAGVLHTGTATERIGSLAGYPLDGRYRDGLTVLAGTARARLGWRSSQGDSVAQRDALTADDLFDGLTDSIGGLNGGYPLFVWQLLESRSRAAVIAYLQDYYAAYVAPYASAAQRQELTALLADTAAAIESAATAEGITAAYAAAMARLTSGDLLAAAIAAAGQRLSQCYAAACKAYPYAADGLRALYEAQRAALRACAAAIETDTVLDAFAAGVADCLIAGLEGLPMKELLPRLKAAEDAVAALTDGQRGLLTRYGRLPAYQALRTLYEKNAALLDKWRGEDLAAYSDLTDAIAALADTARRSLDEAAEAAAMTAALDAYCAAVTEALIDAIAPLPELLTREEGETLGYQVQRAQRAYDRLTAAQQALVLNERTLTAARRRYQQFTADLSAAAAAEALIAALGTVTPDSLSALLRAESAAAALTAAQRYLLSPTLLAQLTAARQRYDQLTDLPAETPNDTAPAVPSSAEPPAPADAPQSLDRAILWLSLGIAACAAVIAFTGAWFAGARRTARRRARSKEWYA